MKKAMIAMSGGVDSSVAAWLMKRDGYDCMGVTMRLFAVPPFRFPLFFRKQPHASVYRQSRSKKNPAAFSQQILFCGPHIFILTLYKVPVNSNRQQISAPAGIFFSGVTSARLPSASSAHSSMPSDRTPASFAGFKFTKTITFLPTISSAV